MQDEVDDVPLLLSAAEARVLGCLMEKAVTTPGSSRFLVVQVHRKRLKTSRMSAELLFHDLLGLGSDWRVKELTHLAGAHSEVRIVIEATDGLYESYRCADDGGSVRPYDHAPLRKWRHLNIFQHECYLECRLPRVKCGQCGKVKTVKGPWEGKIKGFTLLFEAFALTLLREMPVNAAARIVGEHDTRLWRLLAAYVNEAYQAADFRDVRVVGCDELSARKGHNYLSVFADLEAKRVLYATDGKDASTAWAGYPHPPSAGSTRCIPSGTPHGDPEVS